MSFADSPKGKPAGSPSWDQDLIFSVLMQVARRKLLVALADGKAQTAVDLMHLGKGRGRTTDLINYQGSTIKHLKEMVQAGIVVEGKDPADGRRTLYSLSPAAKVTKEREQTVIDFGFCVVRLSADGN